MTIGWGIVHGVGHMKVMNMVATEIAPEVEQDQETKAATPWVTIVWNDPVNLMSYVSYVFESYFGFSPAKAEELMMQVHNEGRSAVSVGSREVMERDVQAMHEYGLWATMTKQGE